MFWSDIVAQDLKKRKLPLEWVNDMKTPSGKVHVGSLRGVVIHDLIYKSLQELGKKSVYTYCINDMDPMDGFPLYLDKDKFLKFMGSPLFKIPSPEPGFISFSEFYAKDFIDVFNKIGCSPKIIWTSNLYAEGKFDKPIKICLDNTEKIRQLFKEQYENFKEKNYFPYQPICSSCGKISTTKIYKWDGKYVYFECKENSVDYTKGCGFIGKIIPEKQNGKMPWKIEWGAHWKILGETIEWSGKDHMTKGGSHEIASKISEVIFHYPTPSAESYEHLLLGGRKMSSSKGIGSSASDMLEILPPEILRFLMVKTNFNQAINFDPTLGDTIPKLFDDYQTAAKAYLEKSNEDLARVFELSQTDKEVKLPPKIRFSVLTQWVQMPNMEEEIKKEGLGEWAKYAKVWLERFAPESEKFVIKKEMPIEVKNLSEQQKEFLIKIAEEMDKEWQPDEFQKQLYELAKDVGINSKEAFSAIYTALIGKDHGPKAGWLILSLDKDFIKKRFTKIDNVIEEKENQQIKKLNNPKIFHIDKDLKEKFPSISVGVAIIKGVTIKKTDPILEKEKAEVLSLLKNLTTEQISQFSEILSYRKLYKEMGIDWHSRRPSPEALLRRIALKKGLYTINTCVDAYNLVVMKNRVSVGAFDLDKIEFPTVLRFAKEGEEILLLGDENGTKYKEGEIAYFDKIGGYNIDFNYRDAKRTAVQLDTKNLYINVDGVYDVDSKKVEQVLREACEMIIKYCGGKIGTFGVVV